MMDDKKKLIARRGQIKAELTRFETFVNNFNVFSQSITLLETRLETIVKSSLSEFKNIQSQFEEAVVASGSKLNEEQCDKDRDEFENKYYNTVTKARDIIKSHVSSQTSSVTSTATSSSTPPAQGQVLQSTNINAKLPALKLIEFSGSYSEWRKFSDTFNALVHINSTLSNVEKFYYLQVSLKNEAAQVIASLPITDANYPTAWKLLTDRYENNKAISNTHIREIIDLPSIQKTSHSELRHLLDNFLKNYRALELMDNDVKTWDGILIFILLEKLDFNSRREWENYTHNIAKPKIADFSNFLLQRCTMLEAVAPKANNITTISAHTKPPKACHLTASNNNLLPTTICPLCKESHRIYFCQKFKNLSLSARYDKINSLGLCVNCLRYGHNKTECQSSGCKVCQKPHNTLLHSYNQTFHQHYSNTNNGTRNRRNQNNQFNNQNTSQHERQNAEVNTNADSAFNGVFLHHSQEINNEPLVLLSTAIINVFDINHRPVQCRVLLDSGSQSNFVTHDLVKKLRLPTRSIEIPVHGINQISTNITKKTQITLTSVTNNYYKSTLSFLVLDKITNHTPQFPINIDHLNIPKNIVLADPKFNCSQGIDMLIGAATFYDLLCIGQIKLGYNLPTLQKTRLGWIVSGEIALSKNPINTQSFLTNIDLNKQLEKFWSSEEIPQNSNEISNILTNEENDCEQHFIENFSRDVTGRFVVKLPLKDNYINLGESQEIACRRLYSIEKKLANNNYLQKSYLDFMKEYKLLGHMSEISLDSDNNSGKIVYLPHHAVEKPDSTSTKVRVVFDASAKTSTNLSLNDILKTGPTIQQDLFSILLRFRKHNVVLVGDLTKMYRQILVHPDNRNLQRIVWRENPKAKISHFTLNTVTYGTTSASFLATRCLKQIAIETKIVCPNESDIIASDFYVDDLLTGNDNAADLIVIKGNIIKILSDYGFEIAKLTSNDPTVISDTQITEYKITDDSSVKTLGISWIPSNDYFEYKVSCEKIQRVTKRFILSFIAKIFDPLGLLGPIVIRVKILIQKLWEQKINWDDSLPLELHNQWTDFHSQLLNVKPIKIPRHVLSKNTKTIEIHGFADASERAYGCCIYLKSSNGSYSECHLLCTKTRVAPLKGMTIPRLELCAAVLLAQLLKKCISALSLEFNKIILWTDSTIVLSWLSSEPKTWKVFVANRVAEIQQLTSGASWKYIKSNQNPADILSRGCKISELINFDLYWHGPDFLKEESSKWPLPKIASLNITDLPDYRQKTVTFLNKHDTEFDICEKFSSLSKLIRVVSYCRRFVKYCKLPKNQRATGAITNIEYQESKFCLIKFVQNQCFHNEITQLKEGKRIHNKSNLISLSPFLDSDCILRVGGRLKLSKLTYGQKHPILLPHNHAFTRLIISFEHEQSLHAGVHGTLSHVRQNFWPIAGKSMVRYHIRKCLKCFKAKPPNHYQQMGELPSVRVDISRPFAACGVDYAGPFDLKDGKTRNKKIIKAYVCVFICMATKAVHIELISDLSSDGFLSLLKRFVSRRGICTDIYSDNATNFVGVNNELIEQEEIFNTNKIKTYFNENQINWHFIPPRSPHFGGLWEAAVKSIKHHLKRLLTDNPLTYEEFYTLLTQIEASLNSRPLTPLSSDPNDCEVLTPAHLILGHGLRALPQTDMTNTKVNHVKRYHHVQRLFQNMWQRWSHDYLHQLQQRTKWRFDKQPEVQIGNLVILREDNVPPTHWILGRITQIHPGLDGKVRVVTVKTRSGLLKRSTAKVCLLPMD